MYFFRFLVQINCLATLTTSFITLLVHTIGYTKRLQVLLMIKIKVNFFVNEFYLIFYTLHDNDCENDTVFAFLYNTLWCQSLWKIARKAMRITQSNLVFGIFDTIVDYNTEFNGDIGKRHWASSIVILWYHLYGATLTQTQARSKIWKT